MAHGAIVYTGYGVQGYRPWGLSAMGYRSMGHTGNRGMGYKGYGPHWQWVTWAMEYRGMGNGAPLPMCPIGHVTY